MSSFVQGPQPLRRQPKMPIHKSTIRQWVLERVYMGLRERGRQRELEASRFTSQSLVLFFS